MKVRLFNDIHSENHQELFNTRICKNRILAVALRQLNPIHKKGP